MEFKVLGASPKNLQAIQNALSIKGTPNTIEYPHADMCYKEEEEKFEFVFPFQMSVTQEDDGSSYLTMQPGRVQINTQYQERAYVFAGEDTKISLDGLNETGRFRVMLIMMFNSGGSTSDENYFESVMYNGGIYFVKDDEATTANIPQTRGIFTIPIGYINVEEVTVNDETTLVYNIEQEIIGSFPITMGYIHHPFSITANIDIENGELKNSYERGEFTISMQGGHIVLSDDVIFVEEYTFTPEYDTTYVYAHITPNATPKVVIETSEDQYGLFGKVDEENPEDQYYFLIGVVMFNERGLEIFQETTSSISFTLDTYKSKVNEEDATPGFLHDKFRYMEASEENPTSGYTNTFISVDLIKEKVSGQEGEEEKYNYFLSPTFLYKEIKDYSEHEKGLVLSLSGGDLRWAPASGGFSWNLSGCLTDLFELKENKKTGLSFDENGDSDKPDDDEYQYSLVWKSEFDKERVAHPYILLENAEDGKLEQITYTADNVKQGLFVWDFPTGDNQGSCGPNVVYPPESEDDEDKKYVYVGNRNGFNWQEYQGASGSISLTGSILNVFDIDTLVNEETGEEKQYLYVWTEFDPDYEKEFHWVSLDEEGRLNYWNYETDNFKGFESIQCFDNETKEPFVLPTQPYNEEEFYLLAGDDENGLYWTPLFETISGICNIVSVTEADDAPSYLIDKIYSDNLSLNIEERSNEGYEYLNIDINSEFFTSSNESITIEPIIEDGDVVGLDFILSSHLVQVNESDIDPGYLQDKLVIDEKLASFLKLEPSEDNSTLLLKPAIEGTGLIAIQNGAFQVIEAPTSGSFILTVNNGAFAWESVSDCENACSPGGGGEEDTEGEGEA